jgi:hypothetical protein
MLPAYGLQATPLACKVFRLINGKMRNCCCTPANKHRQVSGGPSCNAAIASRPPNGASAPGAPIMIRLNKGVAALPQSVLELLNEHHQSFFAAVKFAEATAQPVPSDTRAWSQILVSALTGVKGIARQKGADFADGSDVKAANLWLAIDTPRFNGCIKSGLKGEKGSIACFDGMPLLFFVLWDHAAKTKNERCRVWVVRPQKDRLFRAMCENWYKQRDEGTIISHNFQLHPPRNLDSDVFRNKCGNLNYPLLLCAEWSGDSYCVISYHPDVVKSGNCTAT